MWQTKVTESQQNQAPLTVSEAMGRAKSALETVRITVVGEVSEFNDKPGYKAAYFSVADKGATMPCLMWRDRYLASGVELKAGLLVEMTGNFTAYAPKGRMQFSVSSLKLAGEGNLRQKVALLARKLEAEGLMDPARKKAIPEFCQSICLVTSPRGKAVHDVLRTLKRRNPYVRIKFCGVGVEGARAPEQIMEGLRVADASGCDAILLVRGGGSYEDLMPFNDERLARAVAACKTPVITGIGHEPDNSICDMVADRRASTPTAAAESVAPALSELLLELEGSQVRLARALKNQVQRFELMVARYASRPIFSSIETLLGRFRDNTALAEDRLARAIPEALAKDQRTYDTVVTKFTHTSQRMLDRFENQLQVGAAKLESLSPLKILERGYSFAQDEQGNVVDSVDKIGPNQKMFTRLKDGVVESEVVATQKRENA